MLNPKTSVAHAAEGARYRTAFKDPPPDILVAGTRPPNLQGHANRPDNKTVAENESASPHGQDAVTLILDCDPHIEYLL